jgi:hypothetical protein
MSPDASAMQLFTNGCEPAPLQGGGSRAVWVVPSLTLLPTESPALHKVQRVRYMSRMRFESDIHVFSAAALADSEPVKITACGGRSIPAPAACHGASRAQAASAHSSFKFKLATSRRGASGLQATSAAGRGRAGGLPVSLPVTRRKASEPAGGPLK